jgi:hypothetical protein
LSASLFHNPVIQHLVVTWIFTPKFVEKLDNRIDPDDFPPFFRSWKRVTNTWLIQKRKSTSYRRQRDHHFSLQEYSVGWWVVWAESWWYFSAWHDDRELIFHAVINYISNAAPNRDPYVARMQGSERVEAIGSIFGKPSIMNWNRSIITSFLQHWDRERVAMMDMLLMKMLLQNGFIPEIRSKSLLMNTSS